VAKPISQHEVQLLLLAETIRKVPDALVSVQVDLWPLCHGDMLVLPPKAHHSIAQACERLRWAVSDTMIALKRIEEWLAEQPPPVEQRLN
jgi:hypothetical protein